MTTTSPAPRIQEPAGQQQSPLLRLPRELRDEIYDYYAYDEEGLAYDYPSRTLNYASGAELSLPLTCKMVANEMKGTHLRVNTITFVPCCSETDEDRICERRSIAGRFEYLLYSARLTKLIMLNCAAECVTEDIIEKVIEAYPAVRDAFRSFFHANRPGFGLVHITWSAHIPRDIFTTSFCDAVQYALDLTSPHPKFQELISKACELPQDYPCGESSFIPGSHQQVLDWRPDLWLIPSHDDLSPMEELLNVAQCPRADCVKRHPRINFYFSAAAVCIARLSKLTPSTRKELRSIILQEDCKSVGNPEVHAEGLIKYCTENCKLRFEMQASFSTLLAPSFWSLHSRRLDDLDTELRIHVYAYIRILLDLLMRTTALTKLGMPKRSFTVVLDARSEQAIYIWQYFSKAASTRLHCPKELLSSSASQEAGLFLMYAFIWQLPVELSSIVEDIINDESMIRIEIPASQRFKQWTYVKPYATWTYGDWFHVYTPNQDEVMFPGDAEAYRRTYFEERS